MELLIRRIRVIKNTQQVMTTFDEVLHKLGKLQAKINSLISKALAGSAPEKETEQLVDFSPLT